VDGTSRVSRVGDAPYSVNAPASGRPISMLVGSPGDSDTVAAPTRAHLLVAGTKSKLRGGKEAERWTTGEAMRQ
jgi:hypothetical protein